MKSICYSFRGLEILEPTTSGSQLPVALAPDDQMPSSGHCRHPHTGSRHTDTCIIIIIVIIIITVLKIKNADLLNDFLNRLLSSFYVDNYDGSRKGGIGREYAINDMWNEERGLHLAGIYQVELTGSGY